MAHSKKILMIIASAIVMLGLTSCTHYQKLPPLVTCDFACTAKPVTKRDVRVIKVGQDITMVVPTHKAFAKHSANIDPDFYATLDAIADFMAHFDMVDVSVNAYTNNRGSKARKVALTRQQAVNIANYLWDHGIHARLIVATGNGPAHPISNNQHYSGRKHNQRVTIHFRYLVQGLGGKQYSYAGGVPPIKHRNHFLFF